MLTDPGDLEFIRHATTELAVSFTDPREHNLHAALNGLIEAIEKDRVRLVAIEAELTALRSHLKSREQ